MAHTGPWLAGPIMGLLRIGLIAAGVYLLARYLRDRDDRGGRARGILDERYARGELSTEEYRERVDNLR
jgi:putative membrane protein